MALFLLELQTGTGDREAVDALIDRTADAAGAAGGEVLEATVTGDHTRAFVVVSADDREAAVAAGRGSDTRFTGPDEVRLVGATEDEVRAARDGAGARYLVEWDFPAELTMDTYLARKREKAPLYANVPEVSFLRTYVREDMSKCLCLYDASCGADVLKAREVVDTPVTRLHELGSARTTSSAG
jgi:hypothetical protein